ncbi:hypothetical protein [Actinorhabdospora filicis]|uniref:hypothetical protein n=1 Tax=Actinorhabdospora filicis TaxID=1785913 RepID=UPI0025528116|nr:hypothetical protein [Actinorhabdospora filicis]
MPVDEHARPRRDWVLPLSLIAAAALSVALAARTGDEAVPTAAPPAPAPATAASHGETRVPGDERITVTCDGFTGHLTIGHPDFAPAWAARADHCAIERPAGIPLTGPERRALETAGRHDDADVKFLYGVCAEADPAGVYASADYAATPEQAAEIRGALVLCPGHPLAAELGATAERGEQDAELAAGGRIFGPGTLIVGAEIQPGTYAVTGDIENCHWIRRGQGGAVLDEYFSLTDRRVVVMIQENDYSFFSESCGRWRPA